MAPGAFVPVNWIHWSYELACISEFLSSTVIMLTGPPSPTYTDAVSCRLASAACYGMTHTTPGLHFLPVPPVLWACFLVRLGVLEWEAGGRSGGGDWVLHPDCDFLSRWIYSIYHVNIGAHAQTQPLDDKYHTSTGDINKKCIYNLKEQITCIWVNISSPPCPCGSVQLMNWGTVSFALGPPLTELIILAAL